MVRLESARLAAQNDYASSCGSASSQHSSAAVRQRSGPAQRRHKLRQESSQRQPTKISLLDALQMERALRQPIPQTTPAQISLAGALQMERELKQRSTQTSSTQISLSDAIGQGHQGHGKPSILSGVGLEPDDYGLPAGLLEFPGGDAALEAQLEAASGFLPPGLPHPSPMALCAWMLGVPMVDILDKLANVPERHVIVVTQVAKLGWWSKLLLFRYFSEIGPVLSVDVVHSNPRVKPRPGNMAMVTLRHARDAEKILMRPSHLVKGIAREATVTVKPFHNERLR